MKYRLSKLVPVRFTSVYYRASEESQQTRTTWWQWRGRCFWNRTWLV